MKDRWVMVFTVICLLQLPLYVALGKGPISYDASIKAAESTLTKVPVTKQQLEGVRANLADSEAALKAEGFDSRTARLNLGRALLAWHEGKVTEADGFFRKALEQFEATHGPDSFHTSAVNLRYAEFLMLTRRYQDALLRFELGVKSVEDTMGPKNPFAVRMVFRHVALLSYLGRDGEAAELAHGYLDALLEHAGRFDESFLAQTAAVLDILSRRTRPPGIEFKGVPLAPNGRGWRETVMKAHREGKQRLADSSEEG